MSELVAELTPEVIKYPRINADVYRGEDFVRVSLSVCRTKNGTTSDLTDAEIRAAFKAAAMYFDVDLTKDSKY